MFNKKYKYVKYKIVHSFYDRMTIFCLIMEKMNVIICEIFKCAHKPLSKQIFLFWSDLFWYFWEKDLHVIERYYVR